MVTPCGAGPCCAGPGRGLCQACRERLRATVRALRDLHAASAADLTHTRPPAPERVRGGARSGTVLDDAVVAARAEILDALAYWTGIVRGPAVPARTVPALAAYLEDALDTFAADPASVRAAADLTELLARAGCALDSAGQQTRRIGRCMRPGCGAPVHAGPASGAGTTGVRCTAGHVWAPRDWLALAGAQPAGRPA